MESEAATALATCYAGHGVAGVLDDIALPPLLSRCYADVPTLHKVLLMPSLNVLLARLCAGRKCHLVHADCRRRADQPARPHPCTRVAIDLVQAIPLWKHLLANNVLDISSFAAGQRPILQSTDGTRVVVFTTARDGARALAGH